MCVAHKKQIKDWITTTPTWHLLVALANDLGIKAKEGHNLNSSVASISGAYSDLVVTKRGSPENGGGTWLHPDLAIHLAIWCSPEFAIQVSRWVREWLTILEQNRRAEEEQQNDWKAIKAYTLLTPKKWTKMFSDEFWQRLEVVTGKPQLVTFLFFRDRY